MKCCLRNTCLTMLCTRLIVCLTINDGVLYRTKLFEPDYMYTHNFVDAWEVDEITIVDITRGVRDRPKFLRTVRDISDQAFVPITIGGVHSNSCVVEFFDHGADKVLVNTSAVERPEFITEVAKKWGNQAVVVGIDVRKTADGYRVFSEQGKTNTGMDPCDWAVRAEGLGAGEILLTSVDRDGSLQGYDLDLLRGVVDSVSVPVVPLGGAGAWPHFVDAVEAGAHGVATQNIYHFTSSSILSAKKTMRDNGIPVRM